MKNVLIVLAVSLFALTVSAEETTTTQPAAETSTNTSEKTATTSESSTANSASATTATKVSCTDSKDCKENQSQTTPAAPKQED